ncbi:flagellar filament capping protein FliD [Clostridiaceae bacterium UIB06]|uniref:Flagellar hook-associated protein 2 n=1 Tax=Clostridium thailandense TaxID=2794346 RepID=A0A949WQ51_9CLOT|nr:flagellar filament capping protein FliD [Clostridium thailandense]MBV7272255.1 flagellar filament capping protein FliD [Clostridium thailandense]MCH5137801.1 flagellar filament capping protein FliD [Clostridiaceae bacterium UIB06]
MSDVSTTSTGMTGAGGGNTIRITGMASGLDVDALVKKMMAAEQTKLDKAQQDEQYTQWKQDAYQDIIKDIKDLQNSFFDSMTTDKNILSSSNFSPFTVNSTTGSTTVDTSVATFKPGTGAKTGKYTMNITQLAAAASKSGSKIAKDTSKSFNASDWSGKSIAFSVNGATTQTITLGTDSDITTTVNDINTKISSNSSLKGKFQAVVNGDKIQFQSLNDSSVKILDSSSGTTVTGIDDLQGRVINPSTSTTMSDLGLTSSGTIKFNCNGTDYSVTVNTTDKISDVINNISTTTSGLASASYSQLTGSFSIQSTSTGSSQSIKITSDFAALGLTTDATQVGNSIGVKDTSGNAIDTSTTMEDLGMGTGTNGDLKLEYDGTAFNVNILSTDSISSVIDKVHAANSNVTASFDYTTGEFKLVGADSSKTVKVTSDFSTLGLRADSTNGKDAIASITPPGATNSTTIAKSSNNFTIDGMSYTLSSVGTASVNVGTDTQAVYDKISSFITKYNTIVDEIQTKLTEKKDYNYKPLTDSQKESMTTSQITAWETKAKVGILRNDSNLQSMLDGLRSAFTSAVSSTGLAFGQYGDNSIGIDMSSDVSTPGHVEIADPSKLKAAIATKSDKVLQMFTNQSTAAAGKSYDSTSTKYNEDGIFTRIKTIFESNVGYTGTTLNTAILTSYANKQYDYSSTGSGGNGTLPDQIYEEQLQIKKIKSEMSDKQEKYYLQFSKLETAMTQLSAQQSSLSSMLGS